VTSLIKFFSFAMLMAFFMAGCGGGGGDDTGGTSGASIRGYFVDSPVKGLEYSGEMGSHGVTDSDGGFNFYDGEKVTFKVGSVVLGSVKMEASKNVVTPVTILSYGTGTEVTAGNKRVIGIVRFLMSVDEDGSYRTINISDKMRKKLAGKPPLNLESIDVSEGVLAAYLDKSSDEIVSQREAFDHLKETLEDLGEVVDDTPPSGGSTTSGEYALLAWNDLGMHCMDGKDYSIFSILPPYNNLVAQLVKKGSTPEMVTSGVTLTYEAVPSFDGKWNTTSVTKTNFWNFVEKLFGVALDDDVGLAGSHVQDKTQRPLRYDLEHEWWTAEGIPTAPRNDDGSYNRYPMVKVTAKDSTGKVLAEAVTVLPVSDEIDCKTCHGSNRNADAKPQKGWANLSDEEKDFKTNILRVHDQKHPNAVNDHFGSLSAKGWVYDKAGLEATANGGTPVLCAACHKSNALPGTGVDNIVSLTTALHRKHADVTDPSTGKRLDDIGSRDACYKCHPGATTECLRGAMGKAKESDGTNKIQCQSCHGGMSAVGRSDREGWLDLPNCQSCHQNGERYTEAVTDIQTGSLRSATDDRFATNPDTPVSGKSLYRYSMGHGSLQCSACHGSTHAIYPSSRPEDNIQSINLQGYAGPVRECKVCHTSIPQGDFKGPHGMHEIGQNWVYAHGDLARYDNSVCKSCHGDDYRGTYLSKIPVFRKLYVGLSDKTNKYYAAGDMVGCYDCHEKGGPNGPR